MDVTELKEELLLLRRENAKLRELVRDLYRHYRGVLVENWAYSTEDFEMYEGYMRELGIEVGE